MPNLKQRIDPFGIPVIDIDRGSRIRINAEGIYIGVNVTEDGVTVDVYTDHDVIDTVSATFDDAWEV